MAQPDFDSMNETDVRETVVRPLLHRLGFEHGTAANIRTEVPLRYSKAFLGRKNERKDPDLVGRADYICEVVAHGRWAVEVKSPQAPLTQDDVEQAHTYCAHPEISAYHFMLTNGREWRLYALGSLSAPLLQWQYEETDQHFPALLNIVGPAAILKRSRLILPDVGKPLGVGIPSTAEIIGGKLTYSEHKSSHPLLQSDVMAGANAPVTGERVYRTDAGQITARLQVAGPFAQWNQLNSLAGIDGYTFTTPDEYISTDPEKPTIFQNFAEGVLPTGTTGKIIPGLPPMRLPIGFTMRAYTEAIGYCEGDRFQGTFTIDYIYDLQYDGSGPPQLRAFLGGMPREAQMTGGGVFDVRIRV